MSATKRQKTQNNGHGLTDSEKKLIHRLFEIGAVKFGTFTLKSGIESPFYLDIRIIVSFPSVLQAVSDLMWSRVHGKAEFDVLCGVPYTALPIGTCMSLAHGVPMVMRRKEAKKYGTKQQVEGVFQAGQRCLVVEDLVTSGLSVFETIAPLQDVGLKVSDVVVLIDREQGGRANLQQGGLRLHSVFTITSIINELVATKAVSTDLREKVLSFVASNQVTRAPAKPLPSTRLSYEERIAHARTAMNKKLLRIMTDKQTNLCVSADLVSTAELLQLAKAVGPYICMLKTHVDILKDFSRDFLTQLREIARELNFVLFEDRKYADIGNTVKLQFSAGVYATASWADYVNAHPLPGPGIIEGLRAAAKDAGRDCCLLLLAEMSPSGNLITDAYTKKAIEMAESKSNSDFVGGFISMRMLSHDAGLLHFTPGVKLAIGSDGMGQQYNTPANVICKQGSDVIIVGRGIYRASDPAEAAKQYRDAGWAAYLSALKPN